MTRRNLRGPLVYKSDIEATAHRNRRETRQALDYQREEQQDRSNPTEGMDENDPPPQVANEQDATRTMYDYAKPNLTGAESSIDEDSNTHIANFLEFCDTFKINDVSDVAIRLRLFPFSQRNKAKQWLNLSPRGSITTWDQMTEKFLLKYFPLAKMAKFRNDISSFVQNDLETLYDAWERYKDLLRRCPHHRLLLWLQVQTFYNSVNSSTRQMIDSSAVIMLSTQVEMINKKLDNLCSSQQHLQSRLEEPPKFFVGTTRKLRKSKAATSSKLPKSALSTGKEIKP
ncbi:Retrotransposon gag protein [Gossypium australe]|uniref:Retrotransposon gag protein n=1 Tax=Gossypium australe TaxID=47621 RepID=A0A5B6WJ05_9ROSI|nr:Retrotransposon gag protein [Gossypium australe]